MNTEELMNKAADHIVTMLDGWTGEKWEGDSPKYEGICGWCGVMAPLNRPAFVAKFGEGFTTLAEQKARAMLAQRADFWEKSKAKGYETQAHELECANPSVINVGDFVWGVMDGCKCDHEDLRRVFRHLIDAKDEGDEVAPKLCKVVRIEEVEDIARDAATILRGWKAQEHEGGSGSDDVTDEELGKFWSNYNRLTPEQKRTFYTLAVLMRDKQGRYILIDPEGHDYPRYVILPKIWERMYAQTIEGIKAEMRAEAEAAAKAKAEAEAEARAKYDAVCAKWEGMMEELPEELKGHEYMPEYRKIGKRNVLKMAKAAFPWVRFSVSYDGGWGTGYVLKWKNGPTVEEVQEKTNFGLFEPWSDTFDGMTDCAGSVSARFTDFSEKFGGVGNGVKFNRVE